MVSHGSIAFGIKWGGVSLSILCAYALVRLAGVDCTKNNGDCSHTCTPPTTGTGDGTCSCPKDSGAKLGTGTADKLKCMCSGGAELGTGNLKCPSKCFGVRQAGQAFVFVDMRND